MQHFLRLAVTGAERRVQLEVVDVVQKRGANRKQHVLNEWTRMDQLVRITCFSIFTIQYLDYNFIRSFCILFFEYVFINSLHPKMYLKQLYVALINMQ